MICFPIYPGEKSLLFPKSVTLSSVVIWSGDSSPWQPRIQGYPSSALAYACAPADTSVLFSSLLYSGMQELKDGPLEISPTWDSVFPGHRIGDFAEDWRFRLTIIMSCFIPKISPPHSVCALLYIPKHKYSISILFLKASFLFLP